MNTHEELAFRDCVAELCVDFHYPAGGERNHRNIAGDVWANGAGDIQFGRGIVHAGGGDGEALRVIHLNYIDVLFMLDHGSGRLFRFEIRLNLPVAGSHEQHNNGKERNEQHYPFHGRITSRPTAKSN